jgi:hypothetical protein
MLHVNVSKILTHKECTETGHVIPYELVHYSTCALCAPCASKS